MCYLWWFLAGCLLGWLLHWLLGRGIQKRLSHQTTTVNGNSGDYQAGFAAGQTTVKQAIAAKAVAAASVLPTAGTQSGRDDLQKIEGIGPKINELLSANGIHTYTQLANAPEQQLQNILEKAGPRFHLANPSSWTAQARLCSEGRWDALQKMQEALIAGVDKSVASDDANP
jgi:predicted flap endonuclease-1-like 5' DNA nuclease